MINPLRIVLLLFAFFLSSISYGQQHTFLHYSSKDGLPQSQINDVIQDRDGFLWVATNGGLSRFDGNNFENFSTLNGLKENEISELTLNYKGDLCIADLKGISFYNGHSFTHYPYNEKNLRSIYSVYCDLDTTWLSTRVGLLKLYGDNYELFEFGDSPESIITALERDEDGNLWIFNHVEAFIFDGNTNNRKSRKNLPWIISIKMYNNSTYLASDEFGLFKDYNDSEPILSNDSDLDGVIIRDMDIDSKGNIWLTSSSSLFEWDGKNISIFNEQNGLGYNDIKCIYIDDDDVLWLGTDGNGLYKFTGNLIKTYTTKDGLNSNLIMGITEKDNSIYTITYNKGLSRIDEDSIEAISYNSDFPIGNAWCLISTETDLWSGLSSGLARTNNSGTRIYRVEDGLLGNYTISLFWDEDSNTLHIGSREGYTSFRNEQFTNHAFNDGFPLKRVRYISKDENGFLWFAGINGVAKFDGEKYIVYSEANGLPSTGTYNVEFFDNKTWVGTKNGLFFIEDNEVVAVPFSNSLKDLAINILKNDQRQSLWIGTNNGIYSLRKDSLGHFQFDHYGMQNGLLGLETNFNASYVDKHGNVFFGFEQGLVRFDRKELDLITNQEPPKIKLTNLQIYLKDVDWMERGDSLVNGSNLPIDLKLKPKENYLTFNYSGINMINPGDVRYRFMLEGADGELANNWSNPSRNNFATFSNLESGNYVFKVQATNGNAPWPSNFTSYAFNIKTPFYATWWFRSLVVLFIFLATYLIYSWRIRTIRQEQENLRLRSQSKMLALEQQTLNANMNRHFVFNALNSIQYYLNKEDKMSANRYLSRFAKLIRKNLDSSQSKQTTLFEEIDRMVLYMELEQMRFSHKFDFEFKVDKSINTREIKIPSMLFQPYLENSIWHGILPMENHGQIEVEVSSKEENSISIKIFDNGIGIDTSLKHKTENQDHISVGMEITKNRLALYEQLSKQEASVIGPYEIQEKGVTIGTQVELILPRLNGQN